MAAVVPLPFLAALFLHLGDGKRFAAAGWRIVVADAGPTPVGRQAGAEGPLEWKGTNTERTTHSSSGDSRGRPI